VKVKAVLWTAYSSQLQNRPGLLRKLIIKISIINNIIYLTHGPWLIYYTKMVLWSHTIFTTWRMPVFIKNGELNENNLKENFKIFLLYINIVVKRIWQHALWDPTLLVNIQFYLQIIFSSYHPKDLNSNATQTE
jgi:hypothetical protein